jgi:hypothetical protein
LLGVEAINADIGLNDVQARGRFFALRDGETLHGDAKSVAAHGERR